MTACTAIMECRHKIAFVSTLPIEKLLPWFPVCAFDFFFCSHLYFDLFCYHFYFHFFLIHSWELAAATNRWLQPLLLRATWSPDRKKNNNLQAVNELPSMPSVKGVYKLTEAFVRALFRSLALSCSCHHFLSHSPAPPPPISHSLLLFNFLPVPARFTLQ